MEAKQPRPGIGIYTPAVAARLTGVPRSTLASWRASGLLKPDLHLDLPHAQRAYTYDELGAILLIRGLRSLGLSTHTVRKAVAWFRSETGNGEPWAGRCIWTDGAGRFGVADDRAQDGYIIRLPDLVESVVSRGSPALQDAAAYIEITPDVQAGQPVLRNTRLTTALIAGIAGPSADVERVRDAYPDLDPAAIRAAVEFEKTLSRPAA